MQTWDGYVRVSRVGGREGPSFLSPEIQRATIERLAKAKGVELGEVVEELDVSGAKPIDERELGRLIRKIEAGTSGGVLVWRVSRFSRNLLDAVTVAERIRDAGGALVGDDLDTTAPMGRAMLGFLAGWAEEERDQRRAAWRAATDSATKRGLHLGRVPLGYVRTTLEDGKNGPLAIDHDHPERVDAVRYAFAARGLGDSWRNIQKAIRAEYGLYLSVSTVQQMVATRVYTGEVRRGDQIVNSGAHPAIVEEADWQRAQHAKGATPPRNGRTSSQGVLAGLVYCSGCGGVVSTNSTGVGRPAYCCQNRRKAECPAPASISAHLLDAYVLPGILERMGAGFNIDRYLVEREEARLAIVAAEDEMSAFLEHASAAALGERYATETERRREAIRAAVAVWEELEAFRHPAGALAHDPATWDTMPIFYQRDCARGVIERVVIKRSGRGGGRWLPLDTRVEVVWR